LIKKHEELVRLYKYASEFLDMSDKTIIILYLYYDKDNELLSKRITHELFY